MKKKIIVIAVILLTLAGLGALIYFNLPHVVARNALAGVTSDFLGRDELKPLVKATRKGSIDLSTELDTEEMYGELYGDRYIGRRYNASVGGKLYFGKDSLFLQNGYADVSVPKEKIDFDIHADIYLESDYLYVESEELFGGAVGMIKGEMAEALKSSELAREMPPELYRELLPAMKRYDGFSGRQKREDGQLLIGHLGDLLKAVEKNATYECEIREVLLQGEHAKCRVITVTLEREDVEALLRQLQTSLDDEALCQWIDQNKWYLQPILIRMGLLPENVEVESLASYLSERLDAGIEAWENEENDTPWVLEITTPRFSSKLLSLSLRHGEERLLALDFGIEGIKKSSCFTVCVKDATYVYIILQRDEQAVRAELIRSLDREEVPLFSLCVDREEETFELLWRDGDRERRVEGSWVETKRSTTVTLERFLDTEGNWIDEGFEIRLTVDQKDSMPKALPKREVKNIFDLTVDDLKEIIVNSKDILKFFF